MFKITTNLTLRSFTNW